MAAKPIIPNTNSYHCPCSKTNINILNSPQQEEYSLQEDAEFPAFEKRLI